MSTCRGVLFSLATFFVLNLVQSTEFVPCFIWSNKRINERVPALNKISQDIFKESIQEHLTDNPLIVIFAEQTLSPEDFSQHDESGVLFQSLANLAKTTKISYLPYVQNPIKALKHLDVTVTEVPLNKMGKDFEIPDTNILIVNLNDAEESENRNDILKRHDADIVSIYHNLIKKHENVICIYTAHHISWVGSEEIVKYRQRRSLLEAEEEVVPPVEAAKPTASVRAGVPIVDNKIYSNDNILIYLNESIQYTYRSASGSASILAFDLNTDNDTNFVLKLTATSPNHTIGVTMSFTNLTHNGYWNMDKNVIAEIKNITGTDDTELLNLTSTVAIEAPNRFSFHCGDQVFSNTNFSVTLKNFQIQLFFYPFNNETNSTTSTTGTKFGDAYDCVGFTSVPIWSGLFVTTILLIIMTIGITMMMDIRTMDRFDDAKGKTITINAE